MSHNIQIYSILIIRLTSIGDVLLTTPLIRILNELYPESKIDFLTSTQTKDVFKFNSRINELFSVDRKASFSELKSIKSNLFSHKRYDIVIDLQKNLKSALLSKGLADNILKFDKRRLLKLKLVYLKKRLMSIVQVPDLYINTAKPLGASPDGKGLEFWLNSDAKNDVYSPLNKLASRSGIVISPGAFHFTKRWQLERFADLCKLININHPDTIISIVGGLEDAEAGNYLEKNANVINQAGKLSLVQSAELIDNARLLVSNDSALMHIASARQVPVIALFGSTVQDFGFAPYHSEHLIIEKNIPCRPCTHYGKAKCPKNHFDCMNLISVDEVYKAVELFLNNS